MDDLTAFLAARYDEAWARAEAAKLGTKGQWGPRLDESIGGHLLDDSGEVVVYDEGSPSEAQFDHIADMDPARRQRDITLKRAILAEHAAWREQFRQVREELGTVGGGVSAGTHLLEHVLELLGTEFSGHPDYKQEWAPQLITHGHHPKIDHGA